MRVARPATSTWPFVSLSLALFWAPLVDSSQHRSCSLRGRQLQTQAHDVRLCGLSRLSRLHGPSRLPCLSSRTRWFLSTAGAADAWQPASRARGHLAVTLTSRLTAAHSGPTQTGAWRRPSIPESICNVPKEAPQTSRGNSLLNGPTP